MPIVELIVPGTWIDHPDRDLGFRIESQLRWFEQLFYDANTALNLFEESCSRLNSTLTIESILKEHEEDSDRRQKIQNGIKHLQEENPTFQDRREEMFLVNIMVKREKWSEGHTPTVFERRARIIYAKAFIYALDGFSKHLDALAKMVKTPDIEKIRTKMIDAFPDLNEVRNTAHHTEDRSRGIGKKSKEMDLKPFDNGYVHSEGGSLYFEILSGSKFGTTMGDGNFGEVDISLNSLLALQEIFHDVIALFSWTGPKQHFPSK